ncbi:MAG: ribonuclease J [Bacilli bacterium]|nr:ribonuclease J [Bacilli bacterium]
MPYFNDNNIKIFALGGLNEIGKNMYIVECGEEIIIIDSGMFFPDENYGVNYIIPDFTYLEKNEKKIVGLFITHGHEDHIGGIPQLLSKVKIPAIYSNGLGCGLLKSKLSEYRRISANIIEFSDNSIYNFKNFKVSFFRTNHSIPDSFGIAIKTSLGYILHTGDFKFDFSPLGPQADYKKLTKYSEEGVLCLLSDSTNANESNFSVSEKKIGESIKSMFKNIEGRIIISTFASNVHRVQQIIDASVYSNRKVIVFGRSMEKTINVGKSLNYIKAPLSTFISVKEFSHILPKNLTILSTGSQGEPLAALSRIADGTHNHIKIIPKDTIIFSSSAIPGNETSINRTINKLFKAGANVIINSPLADTHTSGHASQDELKLMLVLTRPKYFVPIHGEYSMLKKHVELAISTGVNPENCFILSIGDVLTFAKDKVFSNYQVPSGITYIDSNNNIVDEQIVKERKSLSDDGMLAAIFTLDKFDQRIAETKIVTRGFIYTKSSETLIATIKDKANTLFDSYFKNNKTTTQKQLKTYISLELSNFIYSLTERRPVIMPIITSPK